MFFNDQLVYLENINYERVTIFRYWRSRNDTGIIRAILPDPCHSLFGKYYAIQFQRPYKQIAVGADRNIGAIYWVCNVSANRK